MSLFKHPEDRAPVAIAVALTAVDFAAFFWLKSPWALLGYMLVMIVPKGILSAWNHHHQHVHTFRSAALNRLLELCYALHTGMTTHSWLLHHVLGHHVNFLDQTRDESRWLRTDGKPMGMLEYTFHTAATAYPRAYQVGKRHPAHQRTFLTYTALTFLLVAGLVFLKPLHGLLLFVSPMITSLLYTCWVTYDHHAGLETEDHFQASYNITNRWFNMLTGNLGYHTAHHHKQGVHWSRLPQLHAKIAERIPAHLYRKTTFDPFLPGVQAAAVAQVQATAEPLGYPRLDV
jgi:fatty acid desaturase